MGLFVGRCMIGVIVILLFGRHNKKAWSSTVVVLLFEAFALPDIFRTDNAKPTPI